MAWDVGGVDEFNFTDFLQDVLIDFNIFEFGVFFL